MQDAPDPGDVLLPERLVDPVVVAEGGLLSRVEHAGDDIEVNSERATALFRILQETLTNVARHAKATEVDVGLFRANGEVTLEVRDNGVGFDETQLRQGTSLGLLGMEERVSLVGGRFEVLTAARNGTEVRASFPVGETIPPPA